MKVTFSIQKGKESEKDGMFSKKEVDMYTLTATFTPSKEETKIYNEHPLFKNLLFMKYNELDKWVTGIVFKDKKAEDRVKQISVGSIFQSNTYTFRAYSIPRITELRSLVIEAGQQFANTVDILQGLEGIDEQTFVPERINDAEELQAYLERQEY